MYKLDQLIKGESPNLYYYIPPEIVTKDIYSSTNYLKRGVGGYVHARKLSWYLNQLGWTSREWYNVYVLGIDQYGCPKCKCGNDLHWQGKVSAGYTQYCSLACSQADLANKESFIKARSEYMKERWQDPNYVSHMTDPMNSMIRLAGMSWGSQYYNALKLGITTAYFYYLITDEYIKIGTSISNPLSRVAMYDHNKHYIYNGELESVIECEYYLKLDNRDKLAYPTDLGRTGYTEIFNLDFEPIINKYINLYKLTLTDY